MDHRLVLDEELHKRFTSFWTTFGQGIFTPTPDAPDDSSTDDSSEPERPGLDATNQRRRKKSRDKENVNSSR